MKFSIYLNRPVFEMKMANYGYGYTGHELVDIALDNAVQLGTRSKNNLFTMKWTVEFPFNFLENGRSCIY